MERAGGTWPATAMVAVVGNSAGDGGWNRCRRWWLEPVPPPTRVVGNPHGISAPTRVVDMSARYNPLTMSATPSRCRQRASVSTTPSRCRQRALTPALGGRPFVPGDCPIFVAVGGTKRKMSLAPGDGPCPPLRQGNARTRARAGPQSRFPGCAPPPGGTHTRTLIYATRTAHKGLIPPLCAAPCFLIPFLVCDTKEG